MEWRLRNQAIRCWDAQNTGNAGGYAEEKDIPMKTGGFLQGEFTALTNEAGDVVVEVKEDCQQDRKSITSINISN